MKKCHGHLEAIHLNPPFKEEWYQEFEYELSYQYIWWDKAHGGELYKHLRHRGRRHKKRGANENTNGLIRQYIPKGSDFTNITQEFLEEAERKLNERPRRRDTVS